MTTKFLPKKLFNNFLAYVVNDESWSEPKKVFTSQKEFSLCPFTYSKIFQLYEKVVEIETEYGLRVYPVIREIKIVPIKGKKETHITLNDEFWNLVQKLRKVKKENTDKR